MLTQTLTHTEIERERMKCTWHNDYCLKEIDSTTQAQIMEEAVCYSLCANSLGKGMNPSLSFLPLNYR